MAQPISSSTGESFASAPLVPVPLTQDQIDSIIERVPEVPGVGRTPKAIAKRHLVDRLRAFLETIKLVPVPEAFEEFRDEIISSIYQSHVEPGLPVGVSAGVALGGPTTQLSLNSFHFAGTQSGVALAFQRIRDFLTGSKMNRNPELKIFFRRVNYHYPGSDLHDTLHTGTFDSIMALRPTFEQTTVRDVTEEDGIRILTRNEAISEGIPALIDLHAQLRPARFRNRAIQFPLTNVIELRLNTYRMYTHKITMAMIAKAIEGPDPPDLLTVVWRSQIDGRIYVLIDENLDISARLHNQSQAIAPGISPLLLYLYREFIPKLNQFKVSGITNIVSIEPQEIDVMKGIFKIRPSRTKPNRQIVFTTHRRTRWEGISLADIHNLFMTAGFRVSDPSKINKKNLSFSVTYDPTNPEANPIYARAINQARAAVKPTDLQRRLLSASTVSLEDALTLIVQTARSIEAPKRSPEDRRIVEAAAFSYALATGSGDFDMDDIIWRNDIDQFRTATNHPHDIYNMYGIDAAMIFLTLRFRQTLEDFKSFINPRHIALIFELLCNLGMINSLSFAGINRRRVGPLAMASYERAFDVFVNSAIFGDTESPVGVSPSIFLAQKSKRVGTGSIAIEQDLTVIPHDPPPLPTIDDETTLSDFVLPEDVIEGTEQAEIMEAEELRIDTAPPPVDKRKIQQTTVISSLPRPTSDSILPEGAQVVMASQTLLRALEKVTTGTPLIATPEFAVPQLTRPSEVAPEGTAPIEDILSLEDISGLELLPLETPERGRPAPPPSTEGLLSLLQIVPTEGIQIPTAPVASLAPPISPRRRTVAPEALAPPLSPTRRPAPPVAPPPPPPSVVTPAPPRAAPAPAPGPASFLNLLPDLSETTIPSSVQGNVPRASISQFIARRGTQQQSPQAPQGPQ